MRKSIPATDPDAYVNALSDWQRTLVAELRDAVRRASRFDEVVKWGHLVYFSNGPALLIRAEEQRVLFGFWRGQRLSEIEPRLRAGGKYEMATLELREGMRIATATARRLAQEAATLNATFGDPTKISPPKKAAKRAVRSASTKPKKSPVGGKTRS